MVGEFGVLERWSFGVGGGGSLGVLLFNLHSPHKNRKYLIISHFPRIRPKHLYFKDKQYQNLQVHLLYLENFRLLTAGTLDIIRHKKESFLRVQFPYDKQLIHPVKKLENVLWSHTWKSWLFEPHVVNPQYCDAKHLPGSGTNLRYNQELLGHKSRRNTEIYTHVSQKNLQAICSPFDDL